MTDGRVGGGGLGGGNLLLPAGKWVGRRASGVEERDGEGMGRRRLTGQLLVASGISSRQGAFGKEGGGRGEFSTGVKRASESSSICI